MRSKLGKAVREKFDNLIRKTLPQFHLVEPREVDTPAGDKCMETPSGCCLYLWKCRDNLYFYILLEINPKQGDSFTIELAWTRNKRFPICTDLMFPYDALESGIKRDIPINGDFRFRISELFEKHSNEDFWWEVAPSPTWEEFAKWNREADFTGEKLFGPPVMPLEEAMRNVRPCVKDAVDKIEKYAMPYFQEIIQKYEANPNFWKE